jgi:hypothetical protein
LKLELVEVHAQPIVQIFVSLVELEHLPEIAQNLGKIAGH